MSFFSLLTLGLIFRFLLSFVPTTKVSSLVHSVENIGKPYFIFGPVKKSILLDNVLHKSIYFILPHFIKKKFTNDALFKTLDIFFKFIVVFFQTKVRLRKRKCLTLKIDGYNPI